MIGLRAEDHVDEGRAMGDLIALGLRHATGDAEQQGFALGVLLLLQFAQATEIGIDLLRRFFADMAGVEDHHVGRGRRVGKRVAERRQDIRHPRGVIDVHLAAVGLDVELLARHARKSDPGSVW